MKKLFWVITFLVLMLTFSLGSFLNKSSEVVYASTAEILVATEFIETISVGGEKVTTNYLTEDAYNWNVNSELQMRQENPDRTLGDEFQLQSLSLQMLGDINLGNAVDPAYIIPMPIFAKLDIDGYHLYTESNVAHYAYAYVEYSSGNGGAEGYYSFNGSSLYYFNSGTTFFNIGTYVFYVYDNSSDVITRTISIDGLSKDYTGSYEEYIEIDTIPTENMNLTMGYEINYTRHYLYVPYAPYGTKMECHSKFIWDTVPAERHHDFFGFGFDSNDLDLADVTGSTITYYSTRKYTFRNYDLEVEYDDFHWISGYTTETVSSATNTYCIDGEVNNPYEANEDITCYYQYIGLPLDTYCTDAGWTQIKLRELVGIEFETFIQLKPSVTSHTFNSYSSLLFFSCYFHSTEITTFDAGIDVSLSITPPSFILMPSLSIGGTGNTQVDFELVSSVSLLIQNDTSGG